MGEIQECQRRLLWLCTPNAPEALWRVSARARRFWYAILWRIRPTQCAITHSKEQNKLWSSPCCTWIGRLSNILPHSKHFISLSPSDNLMVVLCALDCGLG